MCPGCDPTNGALRAGTGCGSLRGAGIGTRSPSGHRMADLGVVSDDLWRLACPDMVARGAAALAGVPRSRLAGRLARLFAARGPARASDAPARRQRCDRLRAAAALAALPHLSRLASAPSRRRAADRPAGRSGKPLLAARPVEATER